MGFQSLCLLSLLSLLSGIIRVSNSFRLDNCVEEDNVFRTIGNISLLQCFKECNSRQLCNAVSYRRRFQLCKLLDVAGERQAVNKDCTVTVVKKSDIETEEFKNCRCSVDETCDLETKSCQTFECSKLLLEHGQLQGNMFSVGSRIKYTCREGYFEKTGEMFSTCEPDGHWSYVPNCLREKTIGSPCRYDSDCLLTSGICIRKTCFCGPLYRYQNDIMDCSKECSSFGDSFIIHKGYRISSLNNIAQKVLVQSELECKDACVLDPNCLSFEVWRESEDTLYCNRATITYEMIMDVDPDSVRKDRGDLYSRVCH